LLRLLLGMDGLKPSILMGKLKQLLPHGVSPDKDLFLPMYLIRLPPSMQEAVGSGDHKTAAAMVRAAGASWDSRGGNDPTVAATMTHRSRSLAPAERKRSKRGAVAPVPKLVLFPLKISTVFRTQAIACVNITITMAQGPTSV
jgi:hypothetical protein